MVERRPDNRADARQRRCELKLACPVCGGSALVPWDRLDSGLFCKRCAKWYRVGPEGLVPTAAPSSFKVSVRGGSSGWEQHQVKLASGRRP